MINSIEIKENTWNAEKQHYEIEYKTVTRDEYSGDFDALVLEEMNSDKIRVYARNSYGYVHPKEIKANEPEDFETEDLEYELTERGFVLFEARTIIEAQKLEEIKESLKI